MAYLRGRLRRTSAAPGLLGPPGPAVTPAALGSPRPRYSRTYNVARYSNGLGNYSGLGSSRTSSGPRTYRGLCIYSCLRVCRPSSGPRAYSGHKVYLQKTQDLRVILESTSAPGPQAPTVILESTAAPGPQGPRVIPESTVAPES